MFDVPPIKAVLFALLAVLAVAFCTVWVNDLCRRGRGSGPTAFQLAVGFVTDFLDTLGIGSFATTTTIFGPNLSTM